MSVVEEMNSVETISFRGLVVLYICYTTHVILDPQNRFTRRQVAAQGSGRRIFFVFLGVVSVIGWSYVFFVSDAFMLKDVEVRGVKTLDPVEVKREVYDVIDSRPHPFWQPARHTWFLRAEELEPLLKERLFAERVTVDNPSKNILRLLVEERSRRSILRTSSQWLWIDMQGVILDALSPKESQDADNRLLGKPATVTADAPIVYINREKPFHVGESIQIGDMRAWLDVALEMKKQGIAYREIEPPTEASSTQLVLKTAEGYDVWFDTSSDTLKTQIEAYRAFQKQKPKDVQVHEYVDVRIPGRVYVK